MKVLVQRSQLLGVAYSVDVEEIVDVEEHRNRLRKAISAAAALGIDCHTARFELRDVNESHLKDKMKRLKDEHETMARFNSRET